MRRRSSTRGFALIEIMIAITIVGLALPALMLRIQSISNNVIFMEERTVAHWIAENLMQELLIDQQLKQGLGSVRKDQDRLEYDGREWFWEYQLIEVEVPEPLRPAKMYRVEINVGLDAEHHLASLSGFLSDAK
ncbi:type II secretion system minor pseudopilin GspI [Agaribacterium haliotis]|uniref:type II secretion system minor pseudopilin GspI n=1 Tax=Agaribacterium haliotis TaxID=2013869 RepID=UPI000BB53448|nr:type II secretion system minor pseudopilin GspI [Agaribacterium haliotis]